MSAALNSKPVNRASLRDIKNVSIDMALPQRERMKSYVEQIGNPYCYLDGDIVVSIGFADTDISLQDRLQSFVSGLQ